MNHVMSDLNESKWNFITLFLVLTSFFSLKGTLLYSRLLH